FRCETFRNAQEFAALTKWPRRGGTAELMRTTWLSLVGSPLLGRTIRLVGRNTEGTAEGLDFASEMYVPLYRIKQIGKFMRLTFAFFISIVLSVPAMAQDIVLKTKLALDGQ